MDYTKFYKYNLKAKVATYLILIFTGLHSFGQDGGNLPYTSNGIGLLNADNKLVFNSFGNSLVGNMDSTTLNLYNPSSYPNISKGQPIFSIGLNYDLHSLSSNGNQEKGSYTQINHFAFGVSFAKIVGFAFGMRPFSKSNYQFSETVELDDKDKMRHLYIGKGNSNLLFGGLSVNALNFRRHKLGIGANLGYLFGALENTQTAYLDKDIAVNSGIMYSTTNFLNSFHYEIGMNYQLLLDNDLVNVGLTMTPKQRLNTTFITEKAYAADIDDMNQYAFIQSDPVKGTITLPASIAVGAQYTLYTRRKKLNAKLNSKIVLSAEYKTMFWDDYRDFSGANNLLNSSNYSFGVEYVPQQLFLERVTTGYLSKVRYRVGASFGQLPYQANNQQMDRQSYVVGFGFPFMMMRSTSSVNFSVGYSSHSFKNMPTYKENFIQFNLGINFTPSVNDRWFRKYKID